MVYVTISKYTVTAIVCLFKVYYLVFLQDLELYMMPKKKNRLCSAATNIS